MNSDIAKGNWKQFKGKVKMHWGRLAGDQYDIISGKHDVLEGKIQERYGVIMEETDRQIKRLQKTSSRTA